MILAVCLDDPGLVQVAQQSSHSSPAVFGNHYQIYTAVPQIGANENLFNIAHGAYKGDDGNPAIGDAKAAFYVNAVELYLDISGAVPANYVANVYIDACESADKDTFSFTEVFLTPIPAHHGNTHVFGRNGEVGGRIPLPTDQSWAQAE